MEEGKISSAFLDLGLKDEKEAAEKEIGIGSLVTFAPFFKEEHGRILAKALPRSASCAVLLSVLDGMKEEEIDLSLVFTVQNEVGSRGANTALFEGAYDVCIEVSGISSNDYPGGKGAVCLENGPVIKVMDKGVLSHPLVLKAFKRAAIEHEIDHQLSVSTVHVLDLASAHVRAGSMMVGGLCIACRYPGQRRAVMAYKDIENTVKLLQLGLCCAEVRG